MLRIRMKERKGRAGAGGPAFPSFSRSSCKLPIVPLTFTNGAVTNIRSPVFSWRHLMEKEGAKELFVRSLIDEGGVLRNALAVMGVELWRRARASESLILLSNREEL